MGPRQAKLSCSRASGSIAPRAACSVTTGPMTDEALALGSRAAALLGLLLERRGTLVTKDEIFAAVWPGMAVEEANLTVQISALRRILDRGRERGSCIQTVPGRGYRFVALVEAAALATLVLVPPGPAQVNDLNSLAHASRCSSSPL